MPNNQTKKSTIDISVVMVSYNSKKITIDAIRSIYRYSKNINFEIIMVDNNSQDDSVSAIKKFAKTKDNFTFLPCKKNAGFGAGNNLGAKKAHGKYLLFLNTDILFSDNILKTVLNWLDKHPKIGAYSCKLLNKDLTTQSTGGYFPTLFRIFAWQFFIDDLPIIKNFIKSIHPHSSYYHQSRKLDWITGAFMIMPRQLFTKLNGFDENIWMYAEELELCYRIKQLGFPVIYQNSPHIVHLGGASTGDSSLALTEEIKNLIYFYKKHKPTWMLPFVKLLFIGGSILRFIIFGIIKNNETARKVYLQGIKISA